MRQLPSLLLAATLAITGSQVFADDSSSHHTPSHHERNGGGADNFHARHNSGLYQAPALSDAERAAQDAAAGEVIKAHPQDYQSN
ncbi:hypothetical protein [Craterilacuibacter sp. RT1T]|uniref:hypothetical protein n=1 Tax=Craterilacuibacter sp. RT1T TaxID=2942211 RepID=UPI0020BF8BBD|nr:hypothetical protein [Craterilacuibacter sp. RT1T]MCL6264072.1 hypothetical protein [Craterilacuibacter sp. RT1T]